MSSTAGLSGSDESFAFLCFGFVAVITFFAYIPGVLRFIVGLTSAETTKENLTELWLWATHVPRTLYIFVKKPALAKAGIKMLTERKEFTRKVALPKLLRHVIRFKILLVILFVILSIVVSYQTLTYDPHAILGVKKTDDMNTVKKAYRALSIKFHPDRNKAPEARQKYTEIRRAYKALADPTAFEEEMKTDTYKVSVALPSWLMDPSYWKVIGPLLIITLFLAPGYMMYTLLKSPRRAAIVRDMTDNMIWVQPEFDYFLQQMGEPVVPDGKIVESVPLADPAQYDVAVYFLQMSLVYVEEQMNAAIKQRLAATRTMERLLVTIRQQMHWNLKKQSEIAELRGVGGSQKRLIANFPQTTQRQQQTLTELRSIRAELNTKEVEEQLNIDPDDLPGPGGAQQPTNGAPSARDQRRQQKRLQKKEGR
eukprot:TRINITY_DN1386_c0_g1_i1.p1 TRINITY_DN1386_c0_g1~~TRINITY_DN1386_c0_g1_i1.p1  ORF type:complete len:424 (-),score=86.83 TRINITY_DN1386_c0_g1_i1:77-1348(-)